MKSETNIDGLTFWAFSLLSIIPGGMMTLINLSEFYLVGILNKTDNYPFGGEGPTPYYYRTPELYSSICLIWGVLFLAVFLFALRTIVNGKRNDILRVFGLTVFLILGQFMHGQIGA